MTSMLALPDIINLHIHPITSQAYQQKCRTQLQEQGALVLSGLIQPEALQIIYREGLSKQNKAYYAKQQHNVYLLPSDKNYHSYHPRNYQVSSTKGCITDDIIAADSPLRQLYHSPEWQSFLCSVLEEEQLFPYADPQSSINIHYAAAGQELGWHFDNSSFAITLLIAKPQAGWHFQYVRDIRNTKAASHDDDFMGYDKVAKVLQGEVKLAELPIQADDITLFRGQQSMHRVTPTIGAKTRMLAVLAYNTQPHISLSESARMTFYGRLA